MWGLWGVCVLFVGLHVLFARGQCLCGVLGGWIGLRGVFGYVSVSGYVGYVVCLGECSVEWLGL